MRGGDRASRLRQPVVAGIFYPEGKRPLADWVDRLIGRKGTARRAVAVIVPHGGYATPSGPVAGAVYGAVRMPETAVILGPDHSGLGKPFGIQSKGEWETPLGRLPIDEPLAKEIRRAVRDIEQDPAGHGQEHSIELQLPFLQRIGEVSRFVPILCGTPEEVPLDRIGKGLADAVGRMKMKETVLLVLTTNLSHEEPKGQAERRDRKGIGRILELDGEGLLEMARNREISLCGAGAVAVGIAAARELGASGGTLVRYSTTEGLTGEPDSVTGYGGIVLH